MKEIVPRSKARYNRFTNRVEIRLEVAADALDDSLGESTPRYSASEAVPVIGAGVFGLAKNAIDEELRRLRGEQDDGLPGEPA